MRIQAALFLVAILGAGAACASVDPAPAAVEQAPTALPELRYYMIADT